MTDRAAFLFAPPSDLVEPCICASWCWQVICWVIVRARDGAAASSEVGAWRRSRSVVEIKTVGWWTSGYLYIEIRWS